jgi:hypothetical protein
MITVDLRAVRAQFDQASQIPDRVIDEATDYFRSTTPIRSGNARRRTRRQGDEIQANYPYAQRLDTGYSRQAPDGMTEPTQRELPRILQREVNRANGNP